MQSLSFMDVLAKTVCTTVAILNSCSSLYDLQNPKMFTI